MSRTRTRARAAAPTRQAPRTAVRLNAAAPDPAAAARLERLGLGVVGVVFVVLLVLALGPHTVGDYFTETDFYGAYADGARMIQSGHLDPSRYAVVGPVYEIALALIGFVVRDLLTAAELLSVLSMTAAAWAWTRLLARRGDARIALIGVLLLASNGTFLRYGFAATTDALAFALQSLSLLVLLTGTGAGAALLAGSLTALAFLTRYNSGVLLVAGLVTIVAGATLYPRRRAAALAFLAGFALPVVPWTAFAFARGVRFASQLHHNIAFDVFARPKKIPWDEYQRTMQSQFHSLGDVIARDPGAVMARELANVGEHLKLDARVLLGPFLAGAALLGIGIGLLDRSLRRLWPVLLAAGLQFLALVPAFHSPRYSLAVLPGYLLLAAIALGSPRFALVINGRFWIKALLAVAVLAASVQMAWKEIHFVFTQLPYQVLEIARTLKAERRPGDTIIARKPHIAFHGDVRSLGFPFADSLGTLAAYAHQHRVRWLYFSWPEYETRPQFGYLLDTTLHVPGLTVRHASADHRGVLYEIGPAFGTQSRETADPITLLYHRARGGLVIDSTNVPSWRAIGRIAFQRGAYGEARSALGHVIVSGAAEVEDLLLYGESCLQTNDPDEAGGAFDRAEQLQPGNVMARIGRGWSRLLTRRPADAAELWRPVISQARDPATLGRMIELYSTLGDAAAVSEARAQLARIQAAR